MQQMALMNSRFHFPLLYFQHSEGKRDILLRMWLNLCQSPTNENILTSCQ
uniref:Uncharacterized protein n=1 Tax=Arundo donax TaxID=35708 RepID=A0A0A8Z8L5_ARUDO